MKVLRDTCAIIWTVSEPERGSPETQKILPATDTRVLVSAISCAEIACLAEADRIRLPSHCRLPDLAGK